MITANRVATATKNSSVFLHGAIKALDLMLAHHVPAMRGVSFSRA